MFERVDGSTVRRWRSYVRRSDAPIYRSLLDAIEADILAGRLCHGDRLPAQREIADGLGVTVATVTKSFNEAARRGIVTARTGSGTFVRSLDHPGTHANVDLSVNAVPVEPIKALLDREMARLVHAADAHDLFGYEPSHGDERHRLAAARWIERRGFSADPACVVLTHGAHHALLTVLVAIAKPGDTVLCEPVTYAGFRRLAQIRLVGVPMDEEGMAPADLERALGSTGAKIIFTTPPLQNPTTVTMSLERRRAIGRVVRASGATLIEDDVSGYLADAALPAIATFAPENVVYITGFSKSIAPGFRLGYVHAPQRYVSALRAALISTNWTAPSFYVALATQLIEDGVAAKCAALHRREAIARCEIAREVLGAAVTSLAPSYHLWLRTPGRSAREVAAETLQAGVRVSPSTHFAVSEETAIPGAIRVSIGACEDQAVLRDALGRIARSLDADGTQSGTVA